MSGTETAPTSHGPAVSGTPPAASGAPPRAAAMASCSVVNTRAAPIAAVTPCRSMSDRRKGLTRAKITPTFWRARSSSSSRTERAAE